MKTLKYRWVPVHIDHLDPLPGKNKGSHHSPFTRFIDWLGGVLFLGLFLASLLGCIYFYLTSQRALIAANTANTQWHLLEEKFNSLSTIHEQTQRNEAKLQRTVQQEANAQDSLLILEGKLKELLSRKTDSLATTRMHNRFLLQERSFRVNLHNKDRKKWADSLTQARNALLYINFAQRAGFQRSANDTEVLSPRKATAASAPYESNIFLAKSTRLSPKIPNYLRTWGKQDLQVFFAFTVFASVLVLVWALWYMARQQKGRFRPGKRHR